MPPGGGGAAGGCWGGCCIVGGSYRKATLSCFCGLGRGKILSRSTFIFMVRSAFVFCGFALVIACGACAQRRSERIPSEDEARSAYASDEKLIARITETG